VSYFAAALARRRSAWTGEELDLDGVEDLDGVIEALRAAAGDDAEMTLLLFEENDEWFAVVRLDDDIDPRVFVSDGRVVETSAMGAVFGEAATVEDEPDEDEDGADVDDDDEEDEVTKIAGDPIGDADLMKDLGMSSAKLLALCAEEGQLPGDILSALCEKAGCLDELEALRAV
jgi:putative tRNA adenosine deaminase-associated protein